MLPADPARPDCACRHRSGRSGAFAPNPSVLLEQSGGGSVASHPISRNQIQWLPQASAHFSHSPIQDPRDFLLPRFVNAGRHRGMATGAPRPASKNLQVSSHSLLTQTNRVNSKKRTFSAAIQFVDAQKQLTGIESAPYSRQILAILRIAALAIWSNIARSSEDEATIIPPSSAETMRHDVSSGF